MRRTLIITIRRTLFAGTFLILGGIMGWASILWATEADPLARSLLIGIPISAVYGYITTRLILYWSDRP